FLSPVVFRLGCLELNTLIPRNTIQLRRSESYLEWVARMKSPIPSCGIGRECHARVPGANTPGYIAAGALPLVPHTLTPCVFATIRCPPHRDSAPEERKLFRIGFDDGMPDPVLRDRLEMPCS